MNKIDIDFMALSEEENHLLNAANSERILSTFSSCHVGTFSALRSNLKDDSVI